LIGGLLARKRRGEGKRHSGRGGYVGYLVGVAAVVSIAFVPTIILVVVCAAIAGLGAVMFATALLDVFRTSS